MTCCSSVSISGNGSPAAPVPFQGTELVLEQALLGATSAHAQGKVNHSISTVSHVLELHLALNISFGLSQTARTNIFLHCVSTCQLHCY